MRIRHILGIVAIAVFAGVPAALAVTADPFGPIEIADPVYRPGPLFNDSATVAGADAGGNVSLATLHRTSGAADQLNVLDRCTGWEGTVVSASPKDIVPVGLKVSGDGTALAVWEQDDIHYSAARPPAGTWGAPQRIVDAENVSLRFAVGDNGDAIAVWAGGNAPAGTRAAVRPAGGTWGAPEDVAATTNLFDVAMSPAGAAVVVYRGGTPGPVLSRYRPAGGTWTAPAEVLRNNYSDTLHTMRVEFTGDGRTVVVADFRELDDTIRWNAGTAGAWGPTDRVLDDDGDPPANVQYNWRLVQQIARHPDGLVAT